MKSIRLLGRFAACLVFSSMVAFAENSPAPLPAANFKGVVIAEIPSQAATLIAAAKPAEREATASAVVTSAIKAHPTIASAVVGAVCTKCPDLAGVVAKTAISVQPRQAGIIARAAAAAAPSQTAAISKALASLRESVPTLKTTLDPVIASLEMASGQIANASPATEAVVPIVPPGSGNVRGPIVSGPYIPLSGTPTNAPPGSPVPTGGRDYARP